MREAADQIVDHYERHALAWDADRRAAAWNDKPWHDRFIAALPGGCDVLGCGSGVPVAHYMAERGFRVTGVDSSPTFISLCRERLPGHEFLVEDMRSLRLFRQFDGVLAWDSFFHLAPDDQRRMFDVFSRHAAPSAVLMFNSGPGRGEGVGQYRGDPLHHASLSAEEYTALLDRNRFEVIAHAVEDWDTGGGRTVWLARSVA